MKNSPIRFFISLLLPTLGNCLRQLQEQYSWNVLDYNYPSDTERFNAIASGKFVPENNLPVGIEVWRDKVFVTVPRWRPGVPSTLNFVPLIQGPQLSFPLIPYPSWKFNEPGLCETSLTTVYRIKADVCDRLWVLDTGTVGIANTTTNPCPYALNVFDLRTNRRLRRYVLRPEDINPSTFIANIAVDIGKTCEDTYAYMSDELGYGLIVYSWEENTSWRFSHSYFMPDPLKGDFNIAGLNFQWGEEGIFGLALTNRQANKYPALLFSPLASNTHFYVSTEILRNKSRIDDSYKDFKVLGNRGPNSHITSQVIDKNGILFFDLIDRDAVGCWNTNHPFSKEYIQEIAKDENTLVYPCDVKVDEFENLWVLSNRMSTFLNANLDYNDINFRIFFAPTKDLVRDTICDDKHYRF